MKEALLNYCIGSDSATNEDSRLYILYGANELPSAFALVVFSGSPLDLAEIVAFDAVPKGTEGYIRQSGVAILKFICEQVVRCGAHALWLEAPTEDPHDKYLSNLGFSRIGNTRNRVFAIWGERELVVTSQSQFILN